MGFLQNNDVIYLQSLENYKADMRYFIYNVNTGTLGIENSDQSKYSSL